MRPIIEARGIGKEYRIGQRGSYRTLRDTIVQTVTAPARWVKRSATPKDETFWALRDMSGVDMDRLFDQDMLGDDLDAWLAESNLYKRTFRNCAIIAGLIERRFPGREKTGRQVTFSSDLIYDVLREHEPDHILLRATYEDAATGLLDIARLSEMLARVKHRIVTKRLDRVSPLAVPALLEISKEMVAGEAHEDILREAEESLIRDAMRI